MAHFALVKDQAQNISGIWVNNPADAQDRIYLCTLLLRSNAPQHVSEAVMAGNYRVDANTVDDKGGCFVMFGSATPQPEPTQKKGITSEQTTSTQKTRYSEDDFQAVVRIATDVQAFMNKQVGDPTQKVIAGHEYSKRLWKEWRSALDHNPNFEGANLSTLQLIGADLSKANLKGANLSNTVAAFLDLTDADLTGVTAKSCLWEHAFLSGASLRRANFSQSKITTTLSGDWEDANLTNAEFTFFLFAVQGPIPNFKGAIFTGCKARAGGGGDLSTFFNLLSVEQKKQMKAGCFIATACYNDNSDPDLETFRSFRDRFLMTFSIGQWLVSIYYAIAPGIARYIVRNPPISNRIHQLLLKPTAKLLRQRYDL